MHLIDLFFTALALLAGPALPLIGVYLAIKKVPYRDF